MFEEWKKKILIPKLESIQEINKELLIEFTNDRYGKEFIKNGLLINSYDLLQIIKEEKIKELSNKLAYYWLLNNEEKATKEEIKLYNDIYKKYYKNGKLKIECNYKNGKYNGIYKKYYKISVR